MMKKWEPSLFQTHTMAGLLGFVSLLDGTWPVNHDPPGHRSCRGSGHPTSGAHLTALKAVTALSGRSLLGRD